MTSSGKWPRIPTGRGETLRPIHPLFTSCANLLVLTSPLFYFCARVHY
jgi:hypothetical protein